MATIPPPYGDASGRILERRIDLSKIDFLSYHKVRGVPTLPGAWILDLMVTTGLELWQGAAPIASVTVRDASFHRFVRCAENERNLRVVAQLAGDRIAVWMIGDICHPGGLVLSKDVEFAQAILSFEHVSGEMHRPQQQGSNGQRLDGSDQRLRDPYCGGRREDIVLSGPFDCLRDIAIGAAGRRARFDPGQSLIASSSIPALVLDAALRLGAMYAVHGKSDLYVPVRIGAWWFPSDRTRDRFRRRRGRFAQPPRKSRMGTCGLINPKYWMKMVLPRLWLRMRAQHDLKTAVRKGRQA